MSGDELSGCMSACAAIYRKSRRLIRASPQHQRGSSPGPGASVPEEARPSSSPIPAPSTTSDRRDMGGGRGDEDALGRHRLGDPLIESQRALQQFARTLLSERGARVLRGRCTASSRLQVLGTKAAGDLLWPALAHDC